MAIDDRIVAWRGLLVRLESARATLGQHATIAWRSARSTPLFFRTHHESTHEYRRSATTPVYPLGLSGRRPGHVGLGAAGAVCQGPHRAGRRRPRLAAAVPGRAS